MRASLPPGALLALAVAGAALLTAPPAAQRLPVPLRHLSSAVDPSPPEQPVKLVFVHHSVGENWLQDVHGGLGLALRDANYFVSDTNYGWGPPDYAAGGVIGDHTDIGHWWSWFVGPYHATYLAALLAESGQHSEYSRLGSDPGGPNRIVMFKSCYPNSELGGSPGDPPTSGANPLRGNSEPLTVGNAKGIYIDLLSAFAARQDTLWVVVTAPPVQDGEHAANARAFNTWLATSWLAAYPYANVAVFDFYNVLTSNGGGWNVNDLGWSTGNHHRLRGGAIEYITTQGGNTAAYPDGGNDNHPSPAGGRKATGEFVPLLNVFYNRWRAASTGATPTPTRTPTRTPTPAATPAATATPTRTPPPTPAGAPPRVRRWLERGGAPLPGPLCPPPHPPLVTDVAVRQAPVLPEPSPRVPFRDPAFGSCLVRVTDRVGDRTPDDRQGGLKNEYSRVQAFNADQSRLLVRSTVATWYLYDAATLRPLRRVEFAGDEPRWHPTDPKVFFFFQEAQLRAFDLAHGEDTMVHDFAADFPGQTLTFVWTRYEGSPSRDGRWFGLMAQDETYEAVALLVYDRLADRVTAVRDLRGVPNPTPDSATISPSGTYLVAQFEYCEHGTTGTLARPCGLMVYDRSLASARGLARIIGHGDFAFDAQGREVLVYQDVETDEVAVLDLASGARTALFPIDFSRAAHGFHFSGRAFDRPGWAVVSTYSGGHPLSVTWLDDQVLLVELRAGGRVVRLAHTRSRVDEAQQHDYWAEPQATANRDLTRILFTSNWGRSGTEEVEMMMIELPPDWPRR